MELHVLAQGKDDPPQLADIKHPVWFMTTDALTVCVIEAGMASGEPSVAIYANDEQGSVIIQTSLDKFLAGASAMMTMAQTRWGWERPEGYATLMPLNPEARKELLLAIAKELEEWSDE